VSAAGVLPARLDAERTAIRAFTAADADVLVELRVRNRAFMEPYEAIRGESFYTRAGQAAELALDVEGWALGRGYAFGVLDRAAGDRLIGRVVLANVVRGAWQNATLGYWIDQAANGRGHATAAVALAVRFGFDHAGLHRIQPAIMPRNQRSARVVEKCGFRHEGLAKRYLRIAGVWEDHDIWALTAEDPRPAV
jgi:[ribosomal protein S5]-alanine N-acetyltransferase